MLAPRASPANTMGRKLLYSGFETCFGPSTQGAGAKTHLKSRFCLQAILKQRGAMFIRVRDCQAGLQAGPRRGAELERVPGEKKKNTG